MHKPLPTRAQPELLMALALLPKPVPLRALSQLLGKDGQALEEDLFFLEREGLATYSRQDRLWAAASPRTGKTLGKRGAKAADSSATEPLPRGLSLLWAGNTLEGCEALMRALFQLRHKDAIAGILACLDIILAALKGWRPKKHTPDKNSRYLALAYQSFGLSLCMNKRRRATRALMPAITATAAAVGDVRIVLQIKLMQVCQEYLIGGTLDDDPAQVMEHLTREICELGDEDILGGTACGVGLLYCARGEFARSIAHHRDNITDAYSKELWPYNGLALFTVAYAASSLGRFSGVIGSVLWTLNYFSRLNLPFSIKRVRILGADMLLRAGRPDDALEMMDQAFACCDPVGEAHLVLWGWRNLAFYHFLKGNLATAHRMLLRCLETAEQSRQMRPFYGFPDLFEMLWAFGERGFADLPGWSLEEAFEEARASGNGQMRGIALRMQARLALKDGQDPERAEALLQESLALLKATGSLLEYARSGLDMARLLSRTGRESEAEPLLAQSRTVLEANRQYAYPGHTPPTVRGRKRGFSEAETEALVRRCAESFNALPGWLSFEQRLQWLVDAVRDTLCLERVALFRREKEKTFTCLAARDYTPWEMETDLPRRHAPAMAACLEDDHVRIQSTRHGAFLYMPLKAPGEGDCVFMAHSAFFTENITAHVPGHFEPARGLLETELRLAFRVKSSLTAMREEEEKRARLAAERSSLADGFYYGPSMQDILEQADRVAVADAPVLILGETGVGKEVLARRIHAFSGRRGSFVAVHPASIPETLFESELFGHEKGAFTGAHKQKIGLLELADHGTLFIDEIGEVPLAVQPKLLRVLQDRSFMRLGGIREISPDFRLISATNQDLEEHIRLGRFREDLYYRLAVVPLVIPPLRLRQEDIRRMAQLFHQRFSARYRRTLPPLTPEELEDLCARAWPGNVRELKSFMERAVILSDPSTQGVFLRESPPDAGKTERARAREEAEPEPAPHAPREEIFTGLPTMRELQRRYIHHVLTLTRGRVDGREGAMAILGMKRSSLYNKIREYGLDKASQLYGRPPGE